MRYLRRQRNSIRQSSRIILALSTLLTLISFVIVTKSFAPQNEHIPSIIGSQFENTQISSWLYYAKNWNGEILIETHPPKMEIIFSEEYQLRMISKGLHPLSVKYKRYYKRIERLEKYCTVFPSVSQGRYNLVTGLHPVLFNDKAQLLQCQVQKASSSIWVHIFLNLLEGETMEGIPDVPLTDPMWGALSLVSNFSDIRLVAKRYQTYTNFLTTRNPFERLLSAYIDKFTKKNEIFENSFAANIIKANYLSSLNPELIESVREELKNGSYDLSKGLEETVTQQIRRLDAGFGNFQITFGEFLNYIVVFASEFGRNLLDYHWAPLTVMCDPCTIRYDFICKFETLYEDSQTILSYIQTNFDNDIVTFPKQTPNTTVDRCNEAFLTIPLDVRKRLYQIYKEDFILSDYEYNGESPDNKFC